MELEIILPCGSSIHANLNSKELRGSNLLNYVFQKIQIAEETREYFGVCYTDKGDGGKNWILPGDNLKSHKIIDISGRGLYRVKFEVRLFPKDPDLIFPTVDSRRIFRQHMKNLLVNNQLGCDNKTSAMLDAFIVQAKLGDFLESEVYFQKVNEIDVYSPTSLCSGSPLTEIQYLKLMRMYHKKLNGMSPEHADILYLSLVQKIPMYGYALYHISDKIHREHFIALSCDGLHFIYEACLEKFIAPQDKEIVKWEDLIFCEIVRKKIKIGYQLPHNTNGMIVEKIFKIKTKYAHKGASRFKADFNKHKDLFIYNQTHGSVLYNSRKEAYLCHSGQLPRRTYSLGNRLSSIRTSIKHQKWKVRSSNIKDSPMTVGNYKEV